MTKTLTVVASTLLLVAAASATPKPPEAPAVAPAVSLRQALDLAEAHAAHSGFDIDGQYLSGITLRYDERPASRGQYWLVQWTWSQPRLGGELSLEVRMDGTVTGGPLGP